MNTILISLSIAVAILYLKWFFAILFLSAHGIFCLGQPPEQSENKENHAVSSSCGRTFSEIRGQIRALSNFYHPIRTSAYMAV